MIDHITSYATDFEATRTFYDAALSALGYPRNFNMVTAWDPEFPTRRVCAYGAGTKPTFWISETREAVTPRHIAFAAADTAAVDAFYAAGLESGGKDNGAPGPRPHYHASYYGGFLLDPDGNNVEAVFHGASVK